MVVGGRCHHAVRRLQVDRVRRHRLRRQCWTSLGRILAWRRVCGSGQGRLCFTLLRDACLERGVEHVLQLGRLRVRSDKGGLGSDRGGDPPDQGGKICGSTRQDRWPLCRGTWQQGGSRFWRSSTRFARCRLCWSLRALCQRLLKQLHNRCARLKFLGKTGKGGGPRLDLGGEQKS